MDQYLFERFYRKSFAMSEAPRIRSFYRIAETGGGANSHLLHSHSDRLELHFAEKGMFTSIDDGILYELHAGDILVINKGISHEQNFDIDPDYRGFCVELDRVNIESLGQNTLLERDEYPVFRSELYSPKILSMLLFIHDVLRNGDQRSNEIANHLMLTILMIVLNIVDGQRHTNEKMESVKKLHVIQKICDYIDENYLENFSVDEMSADLCISKSYMQHMFKGAMGYSIKQYKIRKQIGEAQTLLIQTDLPISEIGLRIGISNMSYFGKLFSQLSGMTPGQYREHSRKFVAEEQAEYFF